MSKTEETNGLILPPPPAAAEPPTPALFTSKIISPIHTYVALLVWLGAVHFIGIINVTTFLLLPFHKYLLVVGIFVVLMFIPINEDSKWGLALARYIYKHGGGHFPASVYVEDIKAFNPDQTYVFGYEPHSVCPFGAGAISHFTGFLPTGKVKILASTAVFLTPFMRHIWTWMGVSPATRENFKSLLKNGYSCVVVPGGVREVFYMEPNSEVAFLKARKGFIRLAMETGSPLVPVFAFGQSAAYQYWRPKGELYLKLTRAVKFTPIFFGGKFWSPIPFRRPVLVVVGKPIQVKKSSTPTMEEVNEVHDEFVKALKELFDTHKARAGYPDMELRVM